MVSPGRRLERMPARTSSSGVTFSSSSSGRPASTVTSAVISFVIEAIGSTAWTFFSNSTSLVSWSTTSATWLFNCSGSPLCGQPGELALGGAQRRTFRADLAFGLEAGGLGGDRALDALGGLRLGDGGRGLRLRPGRRGSAELRPRKPPDTPPGSKPAMRAKSPPHNKVNSRPRSRSASGADHACRSANGPNTGWIERSFFSAPPHSFNSVRQSLEFSAFRVGAIVVTFRARGSSPASSKCRQASDPGQPNRPACAFYRRSVAVDPVPRQR